MTGRQRRGRIAREGPRDRSLDGEQVEVTFLSKYISSNGREQHHIFLKPSLMFLAGKKERSRERIILELVWLAQEIEIGGVVPNLIGVKPQPRT